jgi:hypothetical protein
MDPMFLQQSRPVRDIITQQMSHQIRLIRHDGIQKHPNQKNIPIEFTQDVVTFKKNIYFVYQRTSNPA